MTVKVWLETLLAKQDLSSEQMTALMHALMSGETTPAQASALLIALRMKGETVDELASAAKVMRQLALPVLVSSPEGLVDTCGTGGDGQHTFNISTTVAFVVASAGGRVAKHGNRSVSSSSGSADLLELAGMNLSLSPEAVAQSIEQVGVGFLFAPAHHSAMKHVIGVRRELGVRTLFNLLGPITNPAGVKNQVLGVFDARWLEPMAQVLKQLGSQRVWVVHADDGLDEISIASETQVAELNEHGDISLFRISPEMVGYQRAELNQIRATSKEESFALVQKVLNNEAGAWRDIVCLNAGAALWCSGLVDDLTAGVRLAESVIASGQAKTCFEQAITFSRAVSSF
jgi:anthranilate phosphoribosyltransferase